MLRRWNIAAWSILAAVFIGMSVYLILNPTRTGVVPNYRNASAHWWASQNIYEPGTHGFLYVPAFAVLFTPFQSILPEVLGEVLWRLFGFGLFGWALWKLTSVLNAQRGRLGSTAPTMLSMVLLAVPASLASINNGQTNLSLSAILILAVLAIREERWHLAGSLFSLMLVLKPIALAPWLLAFAVFRPVRHSLSLGLLGVLAVGFFHRDMNYAWHQNLGFLHKLAESYTPENLRVSDLFGALGKWGFSVPSGVEKATRVMASLLALGFVGWKARRGGVSGGGWAIWVASALVLTLFNPRVETNSYVLISPLLAFVACHHLLNPKGNRLAGWILAFAAIGLMCDGMGKTIYLATDVWLKPLIVLMVSPLLLRVPECWKFERIER